MSYKNYYFSNDRAGILNDPFFKEFNLLFKNGLSDSAEFEPFSSRLKMPYPTNIWQNEEFIGIEIPIIRGKSEDIKITKTADQLRVKYVRSNKETDGKKYSIRGIIERDFDYVWGLSPKVDYSKIQSVFENGLLTIYIPFAKEAIPEEVPILATSENWKKVALLEPLDGNQTT